MSVTGCGHYSATVMPTDRVMPTGSIKKVITTLMQFVNYRACKEDSDQDRNWSEAGWHTTGSINKPEPDKNFQGMSAGTTQSSYKICDGGQGVS